MPSDFRKKQAQTKNMRERAFIIFVFWMMIQPWTGAGAIERAPAYAQATSFESMTQTPSWAAQSSEFTSNVADRGETMQTQALISRQEDARATRASSFSQLQADQIAGQAQAQVILNSIQNQKLRQVTRVADRRGRDYVEENPEVSTPATVLGAGAAVWLGRSFPISKGEDYHLTSHVEGRSRSGSLDLWSSWLEGKLHFDQAHGIDMGLNHNLEFMDSLAGVFYNFKNQCLTTELSHEVVTHLAVNLSASQASVVRTADASARLLYQFTF